MTLEGKISVACSVLDELATVGYFTPCSDKVKALQLINEVLNDYQLPPTAPTRADNLLHDMKLKAAQRASNINTQLQELAQLAETALSYLHDQFADLNDND